MTWRYFRELRRFQRCWARGQKRLAAPAVAYFNAREDRDKVGPERRRTARALMEDQSFRSQLEELAANFVILAAVTNQPGTRRVVKLSHESTVTFRQPGSPVLRLLQSAGWRCWAAEVLIGGRGGSNHLEAAAPPGVDIVKIASAPRSHQDPKARISQRGGTPHVHIRLPAGTPYRYLASSFLRVSRPGWLTASWLVALVIAGVMIAGILRFHVLFPTSKTATSGGESGTAATLLLALLGAIAVVLARPAEHPLASRLLVLARLLIVADATVVLIATGALVLHRPGQRVTETLWIWLLVTACAAAGLLTVSYFLPVLRRPRE